MRREHELAGGERLESIFFGGGTPSILNLRQWELILGTVIALLPMINPLASVVPASPTNNSSESKSSRNRLNEDCRPRSIS